MKILLLGCNGQVGWELQRSLAIMGQVVALDRHEHNGLVGDLINPEALCVSIKSIMPDVIVNAAAYTAVDKAENEQELAMIVNAESPARLAIEAKALDALLVHYSTDYVFDGSNCIPWKEDDPTGPLNVYGKTKLEGEEAIRQSGCRYLIFRTSWVYAARRSNFIHTILHLASERCNLKVVDDQIGVPTGAELIADITAHTIRLMIGKNVISNIYHLAPAGVTSWYEYARFVVNIASRAGMTLKAEKNNIAAVSSDVFPFVAVRPRNSRLDTTRLQKELEIYLPPWEEGVLRVVNEILYTKQIKSTSG